MKNICIFEDSGYEHLFPLVECRPTYDLLLGNSTLLEKYLRYFEDVNVSLLCRPWLKPYLKLNFPGFTINKVLTGLPCLFINGRVLLNDQLVTYFENLDKDHDYIFTHKGELVAAYLTHDLTEYMRDVLENQMPKSLDLIQYLRQKTIAKELEHIDILQKPDDLITLNASYLYEDFNYYNKPGIVKGEIRPYVSLYNEANIYIGRHTVIEDFVTINAENGPVYIDEHVTIQSGSRLEGPLYIGKYSQILGARLKSSSIGPHCKIGGEVSNSIFHRYANKAHYGFIGHSYVGEWVNLGAGTTTSNLKNTYGSISFQYEKRSYPTDHIFLGTFFGDYVKTGIGTLLSCGTTIGSCSMIFGSGIHKGFIPRFSWGEAGAYEPVRLDKIYTVAKRTMQRRQRDFLEHQKSIIDTLYHSDSALSKKTTNA